MRSNRWTAAGVTAVALLTAVWVATGQSTGQSTGQPTRESSGGASQTVETARGVVLPSKQVSLHAPVDGTLSRTHVTEGERVKQGALMIEMDSAVQTARVKAAALRAGSKAAAEQAALELKEAAVKLEQMLEAEKADAAQPWEVRRARLQHDIAKVRQTAAEDEAAVAAAELALEKALLMQHQLRAPWDGRVIAVAAKPGATLTRSDVVMQFVSITALEAELYVPATWRGALKQGQRYTLTAGEPVNDTVTGRLRFASPLIDPGSGTFRCVFVIDNADEELPAGFPVELAKPGAN